MIRTLFARAILFIMLASGQLAFGQAWARKMVKTTDHDFGTVARGAKAEFAFELTNLFEEDVHLVEVRSSCGCTTPKITQQTLKTWEKSSVIAVFNTKTHLGDKSATLTLVIDKPYYAELQLTVRGTIRGDVTFEPGSVQFGELDFGQVAEKTVRVTYVGRNDWRISDVRSANAGLEVQLDELSRGSGRVEYEMLVRLNGDMPVGFIQDQLTLVTDDPGSRGITLAVEGRVASPISVSPELLLLGVLQPGDEVSKKIVVRGKEPFTITGIKCNPSAFECEMPTDAKKLHFIPIRYQASDAAGKINEVIEIETDLGITVRCRASGTITAAP